MKMFSTLHSLTFVLFEFTPIRWINLNFIESFLILRCCKPCWIWVFAVNRYSSRGRFQTANAGCCLLQRACQHQWGQLKSTRTCGWSCYLSWTLLQWGEFSWLWQRSLWGCDHHLLWTLRVKNHQYKRVKTENLQYWDFLSAIRSLRLKRKLYKNRIV